MHLSKEHALYSLYKKQTKERGLWSEGRAAALVAQDLGRNGGGGGRCALPL
jgi:hypothetical protein